MKSNQDYRNFMRNHATLLGDGIWKVTSPIHAFKRINTYAPNQDNNVVLHPHFSEDKEKEALAAFQNKTNIYHGHTKAIANLLIPVGAKVHIDLSLYDHHSDYGKLRATKAVVHSVVRQFDKKQVVFGVASHDSKFVYLNGEMLDREVIVKPSNSFYEANYTCAGGIHFFLELAAAKTY